MSRQGTSIAFLALWQACVWQAVLLPACAPQPVGPVVPDAMTDGGCDLAERISAARLIRNPDGTALVIPCDGGSP